MRKSREHVAFAQPPRAAAPVVVASVVAPPLAALAAAVALAVALAAVAVARLPRRPRRRHCAPAAIRPLRARRGL